MSVASIQGLLKLHDALVVQGLLGHDLMPDRPFTNPRCRSKVPQTKPFAFIPLAHTRGSLKRKHEGIIMSKQDQETQSPKAAMWCLEVHCIQSH